MVFFFYNFFVSFVLNSRDVARADVTVIRACDSRLTMCHVFNKYQLPSLDKWLLLTEIGMFLRGTMIDDSRPCGTCWVSNTHSFKATNKNLGV